MSQMPEISSRQLMLLILTSITGSIFFGAVRLITTYAGAQGYMAITGGCVLSLVMVFLSTKVGSRFPRQTPFEYSELIFGRFIGKLVGVTIVLFFLLLGSLILRSLGDFLISAILPATPLSSAISLMFILIVVGAYLGLEALARFNEGFYPIILLSWVIVLMAISPRIDLGWFRPLLGIDPGRLISATLVSGTLLMDSLLIILFYPYVSDQKVILKYCTWSVIVGALILTALQVTVVGFFSPALAKTLTFPVLQLAQNASLGVFLERIEALYLAVWIVGTFMRVAIIYYAASLGLSHIVGWKNHRWYVLPIAIPVFYLSFQAQNVPESFAYDAIFSEWALLFYASIIVLLLVGAVLRRKGGKPLVSKKST